MIKLKKTKEKFMKKYKNILHIVLSILIVILSVGCSNKKTEDEEYKELFGIAIYQKTNENQNWIAFNKKPNKINNLFSTENGEIDYYEETEFLFYIYTKNAINPETNPYDYISNTTIVSPKISENILNFSMERIMETSEVLIFYIYKTEENFVAEYVKNEKISSETDAVIELDFHNENFSKIKLTLALNLSTNKQY